jgi:DNA primase
LVAYAGRWPGEPKNGEPKYRLPKGFKKSLELFNLHRAVKEDARLPLIVVEGFFGCMKVWQAGHRRVVSLMGSMLSDAQEQLIERTVGPGGRVILLFDEDEAGRKGSREAQGRLEKLLEVRPVSLGSAGSQPDGLSPEQLTELLNQ